MREFFVHLAEGIRPADILDVAFVSLCFYGLIGWLRRSASWPALAGLLFLAVTYITAHAIGMYLSQQIFRLLLTVALVVIVVVFQSDIRRTIEKMGAWWSSLGKSEMPQFQSSVISATMEAVEQMARMKRGALIAIRGDEEWENYIEGGIEMDARVSAPLLISVFNPTSPAHDGAVLIDRHRERLTRFAVHLPLSNNHGQLQAKGTRHAAALGLSETCDAIVVVVSEERGEVSVAEGGKLETLRGPEEVEARMRHFWNQEAEEKKSGLKGSIAGQRMQTAALSVCLATALWFFMGYSQKQENLSRSIDVPIEFRNLPIDFVLQEPVPASARIIISGPAPEVRRLSPADLVISFNLDKLQPGENQYPVTKENLKLPSTVRLDHVEPGTLDLRAQVMVRAEVPVKVEITGNLPAHLTLVALSAQPSTVFLLVPDSVKNAPEKVSTAPIDLSKVGETRTVKVGLIVPPGTRMSKEGPLQVNVTVNVGARAQE